MQFNGIESDRSNVPAHDTQNFSISPGKHYTLLAALSRINARKLSPTSSMSSCLLRPPRSLLAVGQTRRGKGLAGLDTRPPPDTRRTALAAPITAVF